MNIECAQDVEMILKTNKDSESGIFSNQRLLMIKAGIVSYFSEVPKKFAGSAKFVQTSGQFPKYTIKANDIDHMQLKSGVLAMLFKKSKLISRNQIQDLVKKKEIEPDRASEMSIKQQITGFIKWTFQCENPQLLKEFYRLTNLFRTNNSRFQPNLSALIAGFRGEKRSPQARQLSMKPTASSNMFHQDLKKTRMSEVPSSSGGKDLFLQSLGILDKKTQEVKEEPNRKTIPIHGPLDEAAVKAQEEKLKEKQNQRLSRLMHRISVMNKPGMDTILEKQNEDKLSEMSRNVRDTFTERKIEIKHTNSELLPQPPPVEEQKKQQPPAVLQEKYQIQETSLSNLPISSSQIEELVFNLDKPSTLQQINLNSNPSILKEQQLNVESNIEVQIKAEIPQITIEQPKEQPKPIKIKTPEFVQLNNSYDNESNATEQQSKKKKRKKFQQFFKATSYTDHFNPQQICKNLSISMQDLEQLMKTHSKQEESAWAFIENNLAYQLARQKLTQIDDKSRPKLTIHDSLIKEYYQLGENNNEQNFQFLKISLDSQISYISAQSQNQDEAEAFRWMQQQMQDASQMKFSSKIMNKTHFKIYIRPIEFKRQSIRHLKSGWIVNSNGHLQQFLAYLRLEKVLKEITSTISNDIELTCADALYLRYKEYEGIAKQWRIGHPCLPIKSIKALQYITRSKEMRLFQRDFPQFNVITQIMKQGFKYRLHLDRIQGQQQTSESALLNELKKLIFPFDNQLDLFYNNIEYIKIEDNCLREIQNVMEKKAKIAREDLYAIMEKMENNISVDTLCKLLGCRIDKKGNIYFHHTILRLGGRQFGEQISLIKRSKKKGNMQLGRQLSKRLMGRLQQYQHVTPISHFIEIYLQIIDFMIVNEGELHRAVPILLKVLSHLSDCQAQQYPIYLSLMKTYLKLNQIDNFIKTLQNCRLFISQMFKQFSPLLDYPLQRIIIMILLKEDTKRALDYSCKLIAQLKSNTYFSEATQQKYVSKIEWDKNNILLTLERSSQAYIDCQRALETIESSTTYYPDYWIQGVLCLSKCWLEIDEINSTNCASLQKRLALAIELAFSRENMEMVFVLFQSGLNVLNRCQLLDLPKILDSQPAFQEAMIEFNETQTQIFYILTHNT